MTLIIKIRLLDRLLHVLCPENQNQICNNKKSMMMMMMMMMMIIIIIVIMIIVIMIIIIKNEVTNDARAHQQRPAGPSDYARNQSPTKQFGLFYSPNE